MATPAKLLVLDEAVLRAMATNPNFINEFSFLAALRNAVHAKAGCNRCGQAASARVAVFNNVKSQILSLGAERKVRLKNLLNAEKVRIRIASGGKVTDHTF